MSEPDSQSDHPGHKRLSSPHISENHATAILTTIGQNSPNGIVVLDREGEALFVNERFKRMWQLTPALTQHGAGTERRAHMNALVKTPENFLELHAEASLYPTHVFTVEITLSTGALLSGTSRTIVDANGDFFGQLIVYIDHTDYRDAVKQRNFFKLHDHTTGLLNRAAMFATIEHRISESSQDARFGLIVIDINRFSAINEQFGSQFGDQVLQKVAATILDMVGPRIPVGRHGEDEFMVFVDRQNDYWVEDLAQSIVDALSSDITVDEIPLQLSVSAGVSFFPRDGQTTNDVVSSTLIALHEAKLQNGSHVSVYSQESGRLEQDRLQLETLLLQAATGTGLHLLYQPIYDLRSRSMTGCEVLLRWRSKELGTVSPSVFLPFAEESGLIVPIGDWVLRRACEQAAEWNACGLGAVPISVNVSARQLAVPDFAQNVMKTLRETSFSPFLLSLELTETVLVENVSRVSATIAELRRHGIKVFIDDFGTGYSSLSYLKYFKVDTLKIDQSFTQAIGDSPQDDALMQTAIAMAHSLGLTALAEGVETSEQLSFLINSGCDQVQGFFLNRPMNGEQFADLLSAGDIYLTAEDL